MKLSRRKLLEATLGVAQTAMLAQLPSFKARAQASTGPDKLLTLFLPGGWMSPLALVGLTDAQIGQLIPAPLIQQGEPVFFRASDMVNLDGSSGVGAVAPLRMPRLWNQTELAAGRPDPRTGGATSPHGWSWIHHRLWENAAVIHGVDQRTVAHQGGTISALTGIAASEYKAPTIQAWAADGLFNRFPDRPLPNVWIGGPAPEVVSLRPLASPALINSVGDLQYLYSDRPDRPWKDMRAKDLRASSRFAPKAFDGTALNDTFMLNPVEERVSRRARGLASGVNAASRPVLEQLHDGLVGVSRTLARDVTSKMEATVGMERTPKPFWAPAGGGHFAVDVPGFKSDDGNTWNAQLNLALRFLKADVCSSVAIAAAAPANQNWDNGHAEGHRSQFLQVRAMLEVLGRLLGEMKQTPGRASGKSLLDETLVVVLSDFARTWPKSGPTSDHWADNSVILAGGGLQTNRMLGGYVVADPMAQGHVGQPLSIREDAGVVSRPPRSADLITTALAVLGVGNVRISGGNGEILGVRQGT